MMNFRVVKAALINNVLGPNEAGQFQTIGFQRQGKHASEMKGTNRFVQVFYESGEFPKNAGRRTSSTQHNLTFKVEFSVSEPSKGNLADANSADQGTRAAAIVAFQEASSVCDDSFDGLVDLVYQIIMDAQYVDFGLSKGIMTDRWIERVQKNEPMPMGELVTLTGSMTLTCRVVETVQGVAGSPGTVFDTTVSIKDDPNLNAGINQTN